MANKRRGFYTITLNGKQHTMHFSMNFWANFTEALDCSIEEIGNYFDGQVSIKAIRALIYSALLAHSQEEGFELGFNEFKLGSWLDDIDPTELEKIMSAMMESRLLGNDINSGIKRNVKQTTTKAKKKSSQ